MKLNDITASIVDAALKIHTAVDPGLLESVYEAILAYELSARGLRVCRQAPIGIKYGDLTFDEGFRADLIVEGSVVVELKSVETLAPIHAKQVLTQLRLSGHKVGLLVNFGEEHLKDGIKRFVNGFEA